MSRTVFPALPSPPAPDVLCGGPPRHMARCGLCAVVKGPLVMPDCGLGDSVAAAPLVQVNPR